MLGKLLFFLVLRISPENILYWARGRPSINKRSEIIQHVPK